MFLSEWRKFPSAPCLAGKKKLDDRSRLHVVEIARVALHASELVSFLVGLRTYQHPGTMLGGPHRRCEDFGEVNAPFLCRPYCNLQTLHPLNYSVDFFFFFFFHWHYSPLWALDCRKMSFHFFLSATNSLHLLTSNI